MNRRAKLKKYKGLAIKLAAVIAVIVFPVVTLRNLRPVVKTICASQAKILCTSAVNKSVMAELEKLNVDYSSLVDIMKDERGNITALETNAVEVNKLKARLTDAVNEAMADIQEQDVGIPLGTLSGIELLSGRGPKIKLKMIPAAYVESSLSNVFDSAGINQTRHQIMIEFTVTMTAILAPYSTTVDIKTNVCIAETVVIGNVPEMFADVG